VSIGFGFRIARHAYIGMSVPLFRSHGRRLAAHQGHAEQGSWLAALVGLAIMWVFLRVVWALAWAGG
jgi:hypothetical protein